MPPEPPPTRFQLRVKAWTAVATAAAVATCLLYDWDAVAGQETVFSAVRPAARAALNRLYGVGGPKKGGSGEAAGGGGAGAAAGGD
jgi:hypothetical protein